MLRGKVKVFLFVLIPFGSCNRDKCEEAQKWIQEAPDALREFKAVEREILSSAFFSNEIRSTKSIIIRSSDTLNYKAHSSSTLLIKWFRAGRGVIIINGEKTYIGYRECKRGNRTANGVIKNYKEKQYYKPQVVVLDSMNLEGGWFATVTTCVGCDE